MNKDEYTSFTDLSRRRPKAFEVITKARSSTCVVAPHGGGIEPGTSEIAQEIAGDVCSLYILKGVLPKGNEKLHVTSTNFDDPRCDALLAAADRVITVHGSKDRTGRDRAVYLGGCDSELRGIIKESLLGAGFDVRDDEKFPGKEVENICNRGRRGAGVQLEISEGLRAQLFEDHEKRRGREKRTPSFARFCHAVREALIDAEETAEERTA